MPSSVLPRRAAGVLTLCLLAVTALVALMSLRTVAKADPAYPPSAGCQLSTTSTSATPGGSIPLTGSGFPANATVTLTLHSAPTSLGSVATDGNGSFSTTVTIPSSVAPGTHTITAASGSVTCSLGTFGLGGQSAHRSSGGSSGVTASTGFAAITATAIALMLLGGGAVFVLVGRRRRSA